MLIIIEAPKAHFFVCKPNGLSIRCLEIL